MSNQNQQSNGHGGQYTLLVSYPNDVLYVDYMDQSKAKNALARVHGAIEEERDFVSVDTEDGGTVEINLLNMHYAKVRRRQDRSGGKS